MERALRITAFLAILTSCGGGSPRDLATGFINHTRHQDAYLWTIWQAAQQNLAKQIDLNPLQQTSGAAAQILAGNPQALQVKPRQIAVDPEPDVSSVALFDATGLHRPDPTGLIACPQPCQVSYTTAYSVYATPGTRYAASWESQGSSFSTVLQYEFENHILHALGYDTQWR
jgi:hypothetical protein